MRNVFIVALGTAALVASSLTTAPAYAASTTRVDGSHFGAAGMRLVSQGCADPAIKPDLAPRAVVRRGPGTPPLGSRTVGWDVRRTSYAVGPQARVVHPSTVRVYRMRLFSTQTQSSGVAVVSYYAPNDTGVWKGTSAVTNDVKEGWHTVNAAASSFSWRHYSADGALDETGGDAYLRTFVNTHGGDGKGAYLGFAYGCDGNDFQVDQLEVGTRTGYRTYDFEGFRTRSRLVKGTRSPKSVEIIAGATIKLTAQLRRAIGGDAISGPIKLQNRKLTETKWGTQDRKTGDGGNYAFKTRPFKSTAWRVKYAGTTANQANTSPVLKVLVRPYVTAHLSKSTVTKGHVFSVSGRFLPSRRAKIALQKYVSGHWKTIRKGASNGEGRYSISTRATRVGKSYWRIWVAPGGGNISGKSPWLRLRTVAPPESDGGSTPPPPTYDPPPPPPDDPPPPPPPSH